MINKKVFDVVSTYGNHYSHRHWNTGLRSSGISLTLMGEGASSALVGPPSSDVVKKKVPNGVDVLLPQRNPSFGLVKTESDFVVRLVETGLGR